MIQWANKRDLPVDVGAEARQTRILKPRVNYAVARLCTEERNHVNS
jgi:hypothetical protein